MPIPVINYSAQTPQGDPWARSIMPAISEGLELGNRPRQMIDENERNRLANALSEIDLQYAPQTKEAGLEGSRLSNQMSQFNLDNAPALMRQQLEGGGMNNQLLRYKLEQALAGGGDEFNPASPFGKLQSDRLKMLQKFGEGSLELAQFDKFIETQMQGKDGITMYSREGNKLVQIGGSGGGQQYRDSETGEVRDMLTPSAKTSAQKVISGADNLIQSIEDAQRDAPKFQRQSTRRRSAVQGFLNDVFGANYALPGQQVRGQTAVKEGIESYMATNALSGSDKVTMMTEEILEGHKGETPDQYYERLEHIKQKAKSMKKTAEERSGYGNVINSENKSESSQETSKERWDKETRTFVPY